MAKLISRILTLTLLSVVVSTAIAQDDYVRYPFLPQGYSSIKVFDRTGQFAGRILPEKRYWVPIDRIPAFLQQAVVAVEDSRFYEHGGIDFRGIARALVKDVVKGRMAEGGSTITQQLVKNKYFSGEKSIERKLREGRMAMDYEKKYSKKQILEMYFNEIYYGNGAWGIAQAARVYFDKNPEELTEAECSVLAGVPKNPGRYNPLGKAADVNRRRDVVLKRMVELKMIPQQRRDALMSQRIIFAPQSQAQRYLAHIRARLIERFGTDVAEVGGLEVTSAMDLNLQKLAEKVLRDGVKRISPQLQGALICIDPLTGDILAVAGDADATPSQFNRAFLAKRQPGSTIKPLIYAAALDQGVTAASRWDDTPVAYDRGNGQAWKPQNYGREQFGALSLRQALAHSNNVITVKLLETIGVPYFVDYAGKLGLRFRTPNDLSLALGTEEVTLHDLVLAYSPLANGGLKPESRSIVRIYDNNRRAWTDSQPVLTPALSPAVAYVTTQMLRDVMVYGTAKSLKKFSHERPAAGKTGTTDDYRDAWFIGYTPQLVTGIWVGHDKPKPGGKGFTGGGVVAPIWEKFMRPALASRPLADFQKPDSVRVLAVDPANGLPATTACPEKRDEFFIEGNVPKENCLLHPGEPLNPEIPAQPAVLPIENPPAEAVPPPAEPLPAVPEAEQQ